MDVAVVSVEENSRMLPLERGIILLTVFVTAVVETSMGRSDNDGNDEDDVLRCHRR